MAEKNIGQFGTDTYENITHVAGVRKLMEFQ